VSELPGGLDPNTPHWITIVGKKHSGKSELASRLWATWPYDRLAIDPTGDAKTGEDVRDVTTPLPDRFPVDVEGKRVSLRFRADPGSPMYADEMDRAVGLAFMHPAKRCLLWVDEMDEVVRVQKVGPFTARALRQSRHRGLSLILCGPRPLNVDPLAIAQADLVYVFALPNPADRRRVADTIGWAPKEFDEAVAGLGRFEYLRYSSRDQELLHFPPIPLTTVR
jgi:hypothetical protein